MTGQYSTENHGKTEKKPWAQLAFPAKSGIFFPVKK
jgi:hypothetical protein